MKANYNMCTKCMYNSTLHQSVISDGETPHICRLCQCHGVGEIQTSRRIQETVEVQPSYDGLVAAAC